MSARNPRGIRAEFQAIPRRMQKTSRNPKCGRQTDRLRSTLSGSRAKMKLRNYPRSQGRVGWLAGWLAGPRSILRFPVGGETLPATGILEYDREIYCNSRTGTSLKVVEFTSRRSGTPSVANKAHLAILANCPWLIRISLPFLPIFLQSVSFFSSEQPSNRVPELELFRNGIIRVYNCK